MKKQSKQVQWLLVAAVAVVWGLVALRFRQYSQADDGVSYAALPARPAPGKDPGADSLRLSPPYPDPFLGPGRESSEPEAGGTRRPAPATVPPPVVLRPGAGLPGAPAIRYRGFARDGTARGRALLSVDGRRVSLAEGERQGDLLLTAVFRDSVQVLWQGKRVTVRRE